MNIEGLLPWSAPREVQTKFGPRILRKAEPSETFWLYWRDEQARLKEAGISLGKDKQTGAWEVCWWGKLDDAERERRWQSAELSRAAASDFEPPCPSGLQFYPFQKAGIDFMRRRPATLLADDMGIGKTIQAIGLINCIPEIQRVLVVTKTSLKENWRRELEKWLVRPLSLGIATGQHWPRSEVVIINYDILTKWPAKLRPAAPWDLVILDESAAIKNRDAKRTFSIIGYRKLVGLIVMAPNGDLYKAEVKDRKICGAPPQMSANGRPAQTVISELKDLGYKIEKVYDEKPPLPATRRLCLSGTPMENRPQELWTSLYFLAPDTWGSFWSYAKRYCGMVSNGYGVDTTGASNLEELQRRLRETIMIRRRKAEVLTELPAKTRQVVEIEAEGVDAIVAEEKRCLAKYNEELETAQVKLELARASESDAEFKAAVKALASSTAAFEEIARVRHVTAVSKVPFVLEALKEDIEETGSNKVLVFAHHRDVIAPLARAFPRSLVITGETPPTERQGICDVFQQDPEAGPFFGSIRACGEGLTLTAAKLVVFAEEDWVPGKVSQAEDRAHRIGQKDNVLVKHYILPGTIDAHMIQTIIAKQEVIDKAMDTDPGEWATEPVFVPRHQPIGRRKEIQEESLLITGPQVAAIHAALARLSGVCDGAFQLDQIGFNRIDSRIGKELAALPVLTVRQAALGRRICRKYVRQLGEAAVKAMG